MPEGGERAVRMIEQVGGEASFVADVSFTKQGEAMVAKTVASYGRIDCAFNDAGIEGRMTNTVECTEETWDPSPGCGRRTSPLRFHSLWNARCVERFSLKRLRQPWYSEARARASHA